MLDVQSKGTGAEHWSDWTTSETFAFTGSVPLGDLETFAFSGSVPVGDPETFAFSGSVPLGDPDS